MTDREASGILATDTRSARVSALTANAGLVEGTVGIAAASLNTVVCFANFADIAVPVMYAFWWRPGFNLAAEVIGVALIARLAGAVWSMDYRAAVGVPATRILNYTWVYTLCIHTGLVKCAVRITAASNNALSPFTNFSRVASSIGRTSIEDADAVAADVSVSTGLVNAALNMHHGRIWLQHGAVDPGVAHLVPGACASGPVVLRSAEGIDTTASPLVAWVTAGTLHTGLVIWAVFVNAAPNNAAVADADLFESTILVCVTFN